MTTFRDAQRRLQIIYNECSADAKKKQQQGPLDDFGRLKKAIHADVKETRQRMKEREELLGIKPSSKEAAEMSHRIRTTMRKLKDDSGRLQQLQKTEEKKQAAVTGGEESLASKNKAEIVDLVKKHVEELEQLEKKRFNDKLQTERSALLGAGGATGGSYKIDMGRLTDSVVKGSLPSIDQEDDEEVSAGLVQLRENQRDIDQDLDHINHQVGQLKEIAINMDRELDKQNGMLDTIDKKVDTATAHIESTNKKLKNAVDGVMKGDRFMINCILICVVLSLGTFIASYFVKF